MNKIDLKKELKQLYAPPADRVVLVDVPELSFLMVDGEIEAGSSPETSTSFHSALTTLYGASYTLKFALKGRSVDPVDFTIMPLEGLWWSKSGAFQIDRQDDWKWTLMIAQPDHVTAALVEEALGELRRKDSSRVLPETRLERFREGLCMQIMHVGPYADEPRTIEKMKGFAEENGYRIAGRHHEIYLGDPRRAKPERLKTILRCAVESIS